jgi:hypothetical protein
VITTSWAADEVSTVSGVKPRPASAGAVVSGSAAVGVTATDGADAGPVPMALVARTVKVEGMPPSRGIVVDMAGAKTTMGLKYQSLAVTV